MSIATAAPDRVSFQEKVAYGLGDTASNFYFQMFMNFLLFFYTDVFGIGAAAAGTMLVVARFWDTGIDPVMGVIADRTRTRWGRFRPYLLWGCLPMAVTGVATFYTPHLDASGKLIYAAQAALAALPREPKPRKKAKKRTPPHPRGVKKDNSDETKITSTEQAA